MLLALVPLLRLRPDQLLDVMGWPPWLLCLPLLRGGLLLLMPAGLALKSWLMPVQDMCLLLKGWPWLLLSAPLPEQRPMLDKRGPWLHTMLARQQHPCHLPRNVTLGLIHSVLLPQPTDHQLERLVLC